MKVSAIVASAGMSLRLPGLVEKPYIRLGNKPILAWTLESLSKCEQIDEIIVVVSQANLRMCQEEVISRYRFSRVKRLVAGGRTRGESVYNGLQQVCPRADIVLIHDGVRPFVTTDIVSQTIEEAGKSGAAICAVPVISTVKRLKENMIVSQTIDRHDLVMVQTPQVFKTELIIDAYARAREKGFQATDDAALIEALGHPVKVVMGSYKNIKITTPDDLILARAILDEMG